MRLQEDRHQLVIENMGLVSKWARRMASANRDPALDFEDFYSSGCMGLIHAATRYDEESGGAQFSTYATRCIMGFIKRHRDAITTFRVPAHIKVLSNRMAKAEMVDAPNDEIAKQFNVPLSRVAGAKEYLAMSIHSIDKPLPDNDNGLSMINKMTGTSIDLTGPYVSEFISSLTPREQIIVECLKKGMQLREIGPIFGVSFQMIGRNVKVIREKWLAFEEETI